MTRQRSFKQRVRARMEKTGESYTAARRVLLARGERPETPKGSFEPWISEERVTEVTGRGWNAWFRVLDDAEAVREPHPEIVKLLQREHGVEHWWAQSLTIGYEQARGLREPGQKADGWAVSASKTVDVAVERLYDAFTRDELRERWLPGAELRERTATRPKSARYDWEDGATRVHVHFDSLGPEKGRIAIQHERLPDSDAADAMKSWWRERVRALKPLLESGELGA